MAETKETNYIYKIQMSFSLVAIFYNFRNQEIISYRIIRNKTG